MSAMALRAGHYTGLAYTGAVARRCRVNSAIARAFEGCNTTLPAQVKIVGCGSCGVDYLASVAAYPEPDQKLRTDALEVQGGGNCANALTAAARLGLHPSIVSKIGGDGLGDGIISELKSDGVGTELLMRAAGHPSPFTYIIVDRQGGTRTCIHTPGAAMCPSEMTSELIDAALQGAALVYFDGRLTEAALLLARAAHGAGIPVLVEAERLRPGLQDLLAEADYVVTSAHFPQQWTGEAAIGDALLEMAARLPRAQLIITTRGTKGSICLHRQPMDDTVPSRMCLQEVLDDLHEQIEQLKAAASSSNSGEGSGNSNGDAVDGGGTVCVSSNGIRIQSAIVVSSAVLQLCFSTNRDVIGAESTARQAAAQAASLNADAGNVPSYAMVQATEHPSAATISGRVYTASAAGLPATAVADTTGAGDAFIGSVLYGLTQGMTPEKMLMLGAVVAACKCTALGARPGLPHRHQLAANLLTNS